jgi:hypothetical protein
VEVVAYERTFVALPSDADTIHEDRHRTEITFSGDVSATLWLLPSIPAGADPLQWVSLQPEVSQYLTAADIVPRPDLGLTCVLKVYRDDQGSHRLDGICSRLTAHDAAEVVIPATKPPKETMTATGTLDRLAVTVRVGPGMTQQRGPGDGNLTWGCFVPASAPGSDAFFADRRDCWVSTYVTVWSPPRWPAVPERWLYPEETLVGGAVSETDAWIASRIVGEHDGRLQEVRIRRGLRVGSATYECVAGQRMVPGADEAAALARVEAMCAGFTIE